MSFYVTEHGSRGACGLKPERYPLEIPGWSAGGGSFIDVTSPYAGDSIGAVECVDVAALKLIVFNS